MKKNKRNQKPRKEDKKDMARIETPLDNQGEYGPSPLEVMAEEARLMEETLLAEYYGTQNIDFPRMDDLQDRIDPIISKALPEIDEAYTVVKERGGGWSSRKSDTEQRRAAVLAWFEQSESRLSVLKKSYLEDQALYDNFGSGQEKRDFYIHLIKKIVEESAHQKATFREIESCLRRLKKSKKGP